MSDVYARLREHLDEPAGRLSGDRNRRGVAHPEAPLHAGGGGAGRATSAMKLGTGGRDRRARRPFGQRRPADAPQAACRARGCSSASRRPDQATRYMAAQFVIGIWEYHVNDLDPEFDAGHG
ncbi:MAG: hypothetical protein MZV70_54745 [Desulfobacterales bacterium]|nr:hypothetical protein [Desulfobacterales bacterium]